MQIFDASHPLNMMQYIDSNIRTTQSKIEFITKMANPSLQTRKIKTAVLIDCTLDSSIGYS